MRDLIEESARLDKISFFLGTVAALLAPSSEDEDEMRTSERMDERQGGKSAFPYPFTKCRGRATKSIAYRFPRTQRLPNRSETILMAG